MSIIRDGFQSADLDVPVVSPTLNLDFANSQELDPRITFTRGSVGTFVNKNGLIETAPANQPRFDYDPISGECRGLLIEESRVNYFSYSEDFDNVIWTSTFGENAVVTSNQITSPDGNNTADLIRFTPNSTIQSRKTQNVGTQSGTFTVSIFVKAGTLQQILLYVTTTQVPYPSIVYNFNTDTITNNGATGTRTLYPNGWIRLTATATVTSHTMYPGLLATKPGTLYAWGAQVEAGSFPTSYIPTTTSSVTRSADNVSMIGSNFTSVFGSGTPSELSSFYSGLAPYASSNGAYYWLLTNASTTERIQYRYAGQPQVLVYLNNNSAGYGGVYVNATQDRNIRSVGLIDNKSIAIRSNDSSPSYGPANATIPRIPTGFTQLNIGSSPFGSNYLNGTIRKLAFYPKRLTNSQAVYLTQ